MNETNSPFDYGNTTDRVVSERPYDTQPTVPPVSKPYNTTIEPQDYGFLVKVGCQSFAVESFDKVILKLSEYYKNPSEVEKKWMSTKEL